MANPLFNKGYKKAAVLSCGSLTKLAIQFLPSQYVQLKPLLHKARVYMNTEEYLAISVFTSLLASAAVFVLFSLLFIVAAEWSILPSLLIAFTFSTVVGAIIFGFFFIYPAFLVDSISRDIDSNLAYATTHMATIAGTGVPVYVIFRLVADFKEYGEVSKAFGRISRDIEVFGTDTLSAISNTANETPSIHFKELLWGVVSVIRAGGDLRSYLVEKAKSFMERQKMMERQYLDSLSLLAEVYTTVFVAGPILFVVMITIMGSMGNLGMAPDMLLGLFTYLLIPVLSVGFMVMVEMAKPTGSS